MTALALTLSALLAMPAPDAPSLPTYRPAQPSLTGTLDAAAMRYVLREAGVPRPLWPDYMALAWCESSWRADAGRPGHSAQGLFQIFPMWVEWAEREGYGELDRREAIDNARLAYLIGEHYDLPRYGNRWGQWQAKPHWPACRAWDGGGTWPSD